MLFHAPNEIERVWSLSSPVVWSEKAFLSIFGQKGLRCKPTKPYLATCKAYSRPLEGLYWILIVLIHVGGSNSVPQSGLSRSQEAEHTYFSDKRLYVNISA